MRHEHEGPHHLARRAFLRTSAVGMGVAATGLAPLAPLSLAHAASADGLPAEGAAILMLAARGERVAATLYERTLVGAHFHIEEAARIHLCLLQEAHRRHVHLVRDLGAQTQPARVSVPQQVLKDAGAFVRTARELEATLAALYMAAVQELAGRPALAAQAAQLGAVAAQNGVVLGHLAGLIPQQVQQPVPTAIRVSEATQRLAPYLQEGGGARGAVSP